MKKISFIFIIIFLYSCSGGNSDPANDIEGFNTFLGVEKASVLNETVYSFHNFLEENYPDQENYNKRVEFFLNEFWTKVNNHEEPVYKFNEKEITSLIERFESSGLRKEIWLYGVPDYYERKYNILELFDSTNSDYKPCLKKLELSAENIHDTTGRARLYEILKVQETVYPDSILTVNRNHNLEVNQLGGFLYGLAKFASCDTIIQNYIEGRLVIGRRGPMIMVNSLLNSHYNFSEPFLERLIVVEIYYQLLLINKEKKLIENKQLQADKK